MGHFDLARRDTIAALATAPQASAIAVIRISGPDANTIRARIFHPTRSHAQRPFVATLGHVLDVSTKNGPPKILDEALCVHFPEGKSYTGETAFELSLHGGKTRVQSVLRSLLAAGCRLAEPGEFTLRAVLTGKMDLTEAEAVHQLVAARSDEAARVALRNLSGGLSAVLQPVRESIIDALAELEARLDFPDEELGESATEKLCSLLERAGQSLHKLLAGALLGRRLTEGARVVLYGAPNAGKSTLLNALLGEDRALVHESPGTTRDVLEAECVIGGIPVLLVDVAGIRENADVHPVEALGIAKAKQELQRADAVLLVVDSTSEGVGQQFETWQAHVGEVPALYILNKVDVVSDAHKTELLRAHETSTKHSRWAQGLYAVSGREGEGISTLTKALQNALGADDAQEKDEALLAGARQRDEVEQAAEALHHGVEALRAGWDHEVVASELRGAGRCLDRLLGKDLNEDVLDTVFTRFCIGK